MQINYYVGQKLWLEHHTARRRHSEGNGREVAVVKIGRNYVDLDYCQGRHPLKVKKGTVAARFFKNITYGILWPSKEACEERRKIRRLWSEFTHHLVHTSAPEGLTIKDLEVACVLLGTRPEGK